MTRHKWTRWFYPVRPERAFIMLAIPFGLLFSLVTAPFQAPDEYVHFFRAYLVSTGSAFTAEGSIPASVRDFSREVSQDLPGNDQNKQSKRTLLAEFSRKFEEQPQAKVNVHFTMIYSPTAYLPQVAGVLTGRLLRLPPVLIFWLARFTNLAVWIGFVAVAIRVTPIHKWVFFSLALMPMSLFLAASCSADALTIGLSFLLIAMLLRVVIFPSRAVDWREWVLLAITGVLLAVSKSIYALLLGLIVLLPFRHPSRWKQISAAAALKIILVFLTGASWLYLSSHLADVAFVSGAGSRMAYAAAHPGELAQILAKTFQVNFAFQSRMYIGVLGWADTALPGWVYPLAYALLAAAALLDAHPTIGLRVYEKIIIGALAFAFSIVLVFSFFHPARSVASGFIRLVQGRYFIPFGPLYFLPFYNRRLRLDADSPGWLVLIAGVALVLLASLRALLWRYYAV